MLNDKTQQELNHSYQKTLLIWFGMVGSVGMYLVFSYLVTQNKKSAVSDFVNIVNMLRPFFVLASFGSVGAAYFIKQALLKKSMSHTYTPSEHIIAAYHTACLVTFALSESCVLYGLVLTVISQNIKEIFPFAGMSAVSFFIYFPRKSELHALLLENLRLPKTKL